MYLLCSDTKYRSFRLRHHIVIIDVSYDNCSIEEVNAYKQILKLKYSIYVLLLNTVPELLLSYISILSKCATMQSFFAVQAICNWSRRFTMHAVCRKTPL